MMSDAKLQASTDEIRRFIEYITEGWDGLDQNVMFEIRALGEGCQPQTAKFALDWVDDAAAWCGNMNALNRNIYMCINPVDANAGGRNATDKDIVAAFWSFADADEADGMQNILSFAGPQYTMSVKTGTTPFLRGHAYWRLEEPCMNLEAWSDVQRGITAALKTDEVVVNPSRIMRVAGTVSWPNKKKMAKGYVPELVTMRTEFKTDRDPVPFERMMRAFPAPRVATSTASTAAEGGIEIDLGQQAMDRALAEQSILSGKDWHHNMVRLVASYVSRGLSDQEIHALTDRFTLDGYTIEETRREVQQAIDGARAKGWTPQEDAAAKRMAEQVPEFDAPEPAEAVSEPQVASWPTPVPEINAALLPRRRWVYGTHHIRQYLSVTASAGGIGKTSLTMVEGLAVATGRPLLEEQVKEQTNVWIVNLEDPRIEMELRLAAAMQHYLIRYDEISGKLFMDGEDDISITLAAENKEGIIQNDKLLEYMTAKIREHNIGLVIVDPFVSMHMVNENSNMAIQVVVSMLRKLARETDAAVQIVHHVRKGNGEDSTIDSVRGAGSLIGAARAARVINRVSPDDAVKLGVKLEDAIGIFRVDDGKANLAPPANKAVYRKMHGVQIANGEWIGVAVPFELPDEWSGLDENTVNQILRKIDAGPSEGEMYSARPQDKERFVGHLFDDLWPDGHQNHKTAAQVAAIVKKWIETGLVEVVDYKSPAQRKDRKGIMATGRVGEMK